MVMCTFTGDLPAAALPMHLEEKLYRAPVPICLASDPRRASTIVRHDDKQLRFPPFPDRETSFSFHICPPWQPPSAVSSTQREHNPSIYSPPRSHGTSSAFYDLVFIAFAASTTADNIFIPSSIISALPSFPQIASLPTLAIVTSAHLTPTVRLTSRTFHCRVRCSTIHPPRKVPRRVFFSYSMIPLIADVPF